MSHIILIYTICPELFFRSVVLKGLKQSLAIPTAVVRTISCADPAGGGGRGS